MKRKRIVKTDEAGNELPTISLSMRRPVIRAIWVVLLAVVVIAISIGRKRQAKEREALRESQLVEMNETEQSSLPAIEPTPAEDESLASSEGVRIAKIGETVVTLEEILYAWKRMREGERPTSENLERFTTEYMNNVMLAEEARRRGIDEERNHRLETDFYERQLLVQGLLRSVLPEVDDESVQSFYEDNVQSFTAPASAAIEHIFVDTADKATEAGERLAAGEPFQEVARELSLDARSLRGGTQLGRVDAETLAIPFVGPMPGLAARLTQYDDTTTTGPIQSTRGYHWFRVSERAPERAVPLEEIRDEVEMLLRRKQLEAAQAALTAQLKQEIPIEIYEEKISEAVKKAGERRRQSDDGEATETR